VQPRNDGQTVQAEVYNATGMSIYKVSLRFSNGKAGLQAGNIAPGSYLLKLTDSKGQHQLLKFTVL
jgi:hypothetical protein